VRSICGGPQKGAGGVESLKHIADMARFGVAQKIIEEKGRIRGI
jgi:hypothetical protein